MENKENSAMENQLQNEDVAVQRNKELFEYEMTEVKLMLAGRFKHISAADMQNAGADVVIRDTNLQLKDHNKLTESEVTFNHPQITNVDLSLLRVCKIDKAEHAISGVTVEKEKKIIRTKCSLHDVGVSFSEDSAKETKVQFIPPQVSVDLEDISLPQTAIVNINPKKIDIPKVSEVNSEHENWKLTYKKVEPVVEFEVPQVGQIKTVDTSEPKLEVSVSIHKIDKPLNIRKTQAHIDVEMPEMLGGVNTKGLSSKNIKTADINVSNINIESTKKPRFHQLDTPIPVEINMTVTPVRRHLGVMLNDNYCLLTGKIEDISIALKTLSFTPVKHAVKCKCELPSIASTVSRKSMDSSPVTISIGNSVNVEKSLKHRNTSKVDMSELGIVDIPKKRTLKNESLNFDDMIIKLETLPHALQQVTKCQVAESSVEIEFESVVGIAPKKCHVKSIRVNGDTVNPPPISIKMLKSLAKINKPQVDAEKMKITPLAPVSDIIGKVQSISRGVLPKGLTYEEMCRRCVVSVRKLDYQPAFEDILGTLKAELNS